MGGACPQDHLLRFGLEVQSGASQWHSIIDLPANSADLSVLGVTLYNSGNGRLDPGEALELSVRIGNSGASAAGEVSATLHSLSPWISVTDPFGAYGTILVGGIAENSLDRFAVRADAGTYQGHLAHFRLVTSFNGGASDTSYTSLTVGQCSSDDPVGPDRYGYYAFDNTDLSYPDAPTYNWVEINPSLGGAGTQVQLGDYGPYQDKSRTVALPFSFQYYGSTFTRATICSNGWIALGDTYLTDYRNWAIPGAGAPQNMIAAFWDDLEETAGGGHVYQYYDAAQHRWIVEWSRLENAYLSYLETFQAILYDPAFHPTTSGDGIIDLQFNQVQNADYVDQYATVGIQNADHTDGVMYTFYAAYPVGAAPLTAGRSVRFLPHRVDPAGVPEDRSARPALELKGNRNPFSGGTVLSFSLAEAGPARLTIHDVQGRLVRSLVNATLASGAHTAAWDGADETGRRVPAGVYLYRLESGGSSRIRKVTKLD